MENVGATSISSATSFFTPLIISMIGMLSTLLALTAYHTMVKYCIRRQEATRRFLLRPPLPVPIGSNRALPVGVDKKLLETIHIVPYQADQANCVVCLEDMMEGEMVRVLPKCQHAFHVPCIDKWFIGHDGCPICRKPIVSPIDKSSCGSDEEESIVTVEVEVLQENIPSGGEGDHMQLAQDLNNSPSRGHLRHCVSLVLPWEKRPAHLVTRLRRSLSMDQSFVVINIQRDIDERDSSLSSSSPSSSSSKDDEMRNRLFASESIRQMDSVSLRLVSSLSRLRVSGDRRIIPY